MKILQPDSHSKSKLSPPDCNFMMLTVALTNQTTTSGRAERTSGNNSCTEAIIQFDQRIASAQRCHHIGAPKAWGLADEHHVRVLTFPLGWTQQRG